MMLLAGVWGSLLVYQLLLVSGWTIKLREPSLSLFLILHFTLVFMISGYYVDEFRLSAVTLYFAGLLLVSFRLSGKAMVAVAVLGSASYAVMLWLELNDRWNQWSFSVEALQWLVFSMIAISFAITGGGINRLRNTLEDKNRELAKAVDQQLFAGCFDGHFFNLLTKVLQVSGETAVKDRRHGLLVRATQ